MKLTKITAVALALLVVGAGAVAAIPGQAADQAQEHGNENASDAGADHSGDAGAPDDAGNAGEANDSDASASEEAADRRGPPTDLPDAVPDHVSQIHQAIDDWFEGGKEGSLGDAISDIVGGDAADDAGDERPDDAADERPDDAGTSTDDGTGSDE